MKVRSPPLRRHARSARRIVSWILLLAAALLGVVACHDDSDAARVATHARQMRDVSRMLDAMEEPPPPTGATGATPWPPVAVKATPALPDPTRHPWTDRLASANGWWAALAGAIAGAAGVLAFRRRRTVAPASAAPSIAAFFAEPAEPTTGRPDPPTPLESPGIADPVRMDTAAIDMPTADVTAPTWVYRTSSYETPDLYLEPEPVDLLVASGEDDIGLSPETGTTSPRDTSHAALLDRLITLHENTEGTPGLHVTGDPSFPRLRRTGKASGAIEAWERHLRSYFATEGKDTRSLASWLLADLLSLRSLDERTREADTTLAEAAALLHEGALAAPTDDRDRWRARIVQVELTRIGRQSGATRLFSVRAWHERSEPDRRGGDPHLVDAWIDVHLAWASWLRGAGVAAHLDETEALCDHLATLGPHAATNALRRRAEACLQRADAERPAHRLVHLDRAQALLQEAHDRLSDASSSLLLARTAHARANLLPAVDAADACSLALMHAFMAEQDPTCRVDALACRLAIQLTYEALPEHAAQGDVAGMLARELAALDTDSGQPPATRTLAATRGTHRPTPGKS